jgi:hypothetical protein
MWRSGQKLTSNTSGEDIVASGHDALYANTTGSNNVASGNGALFENTEGSNNVASGIHALSSNTEGSNNVAIGIEALYSNIKGLSNVASGNQALRENKTGSFNIASGADALESNTEGNENVASGHQAMKDNTSGSWNTASGAEALESNTSGENNVADGDEALYLNQTGSENVGLGWKAGKQVVKSQNIDISNEGEATDSGTIRIGTEKTQTKAFVAGIANTSLRGCFVQVTSEGQLGCNEKAAVEGATGPQGPAGATGPTGPTATASSNAAVASFASFQNVPSGNCLNYTMLAGQGNGYCPKTTTGFSSSSLLAGMPDNGGKVSNLYAETNATVGYREEATVTVIDNTSGAKLLSCKVKSSSKGVCSNPETAPAPAAPGDRIEVQITSSGSYCNNKEWQVRFRY